MKAEMVKEIIATELGILEHEVQESSTLQNGLSVDSLDIMDIIFALEEKTGIEIDVEDAKKWVFVRDVINYMEDR